MIARRTLIWMVQFPLVHSFGCQVFIPDVDDTNGLPAKLMWTDDEGDIIQGADPCHVVHRPFVHTHLQVLEVL